MIMAFPPNFEWKRGDIDEEKHENPNVTDKGHSKTQEEDAEDDGKDGKKEKNKTKPVGSAQSRGKHAGMPKALQAECHIFYARRCMDVVDGLPKWVGHKEKSEQCGETD